MSSVTFESGRETERLEASRIEPASSLGRGSSLSLSLSANLSLHSIEQPICPRSMDYLPFFCRESTLPPLPVVLPPSALSFRLRERCWSRYFQHPRHLSRSGLGRFARLGFGAIRVFVEDTSSEVLEPKSY